MLPKATEGYQVLTPANACAEERPLLAEVGVATISVESDSSDCVSRVTTGLAPRTHDVVDPREAQFSC